MFFFAGSPLETISKHIFLSAQSNILNVYDYISNKTFNLFAFSGNFLRSRM